MGNSKSKKKHQEYFLDPPQSDILDNLPNPPPSSKEELKVYNVPFSETENLVSSASAPLKPTQCNSKEDLQNNWFRWKEEFKTHIKFQKLTLDHEHSLLIFKTYMGPFVCQICKQFTFKNPDDGMKIQKIFQKLDEYCLFGMRCREPNEDVYSYVKNLKAIAATKQPHGIDTDLMVKRKLWDEVDTEKFVELVRQIEEKCGNKIEISTLTLRQFAAIWKGYETIESIRSNRHSSNKCPNNIVTDCGYCGTTHVERNCPAYGETCSRCEKLHHFSWKCRHAWITNCIYCGMGHINNREKCMAVKSVCPGCKKRGHLISACRKSKRRDRRWFS